MLTRHIGSWRSANPSLACSCVPTSPNRFLSTSAPRLSNKAKGKRRVKDPVDQFYSDSLKLPKTAFPLRAEANRREKLFWKRTTDNLYRWQVRARRGILGGQGGPLY